MSSERGSEQQRGAPVLGGCEGILDVLMSWLAVPEGVQLWGCGVEVVEASGKHPDPVVLVGMGRWADTRKQVLQLGQV